MAGCNNAASMTGTHNMDCQEGDRIIVGSNLVIYVLEVDEDTVSLRFDTLSVGIDDERELAVGQVCNLPASSHRTG